MHKLDITDNHVVNFYKWLTNVGFCEVYDYQKSGVHAALTVLELSRLFHDNIRLLLDKETYVNLYTKNSTKIFMELLKDAENKGYMYSRFYNDTTGTFSAEYNKVYFYTPKYINRRKTIQKIKNNNKKCLHSN